MGKYGQSVWMGRLPERVRSRDIEDFFRGYGKILDVSIKTKFGKKNLKITSKCYIIGVLKNIFFMLKFLSFIFKLSSSLRTKEMQRMRFAI